MTTDQNSSGPQLVAAPRIGAPPKVVSPARVLSVVVLGAWAGLFWFLMIGDRTLLYLSTRTDWVVPVGAIVLTIAFLGRLPSIRSVNHEPLTRGSAAWFALIVMPVVLIVALPPVSLGSFAASRRSAVGGSGFAGSVEGISTGDVTLVDVAGALRSGKGMKALAGRAGDEATFVGFVARDEGMPADEFVLTRFLISCCVADALSVQVRVVGAPPGAFKPDDWVKVTGNVYPLGREVLVDASTAERVERPKHPYLNP